MSYRINFETVADTSNGARVTLVRMPIALYRAIQAFVVKSGTKNFEKYRYNSADDSYTAKTSKRYKVKGDLLHTPAYSALSSQMLGLMFEKSSIKSSYASKAVGRTEDYDFALLDEVIKASTEDGDVFRTKKYIFFLVVSREDPNEFNDWLSEFFTHALSLLQEMSVRISGCTEVHTEREIDNIRGDDDEDWC